MSANSPAVSNGRLASCRAFYYGLTIGVEVLILAFILRSAWTWPRRLASPATPAASAYPEPLRTQQHA
jgi:hypothetical protein